tara:strand:- start:261 stop:497 length:237 start_codon:yes stop_codon:yes gene_type:complete
MSHEGNDKIIDNERDNLRTTLTQNMTYAAIELGIGVVQEIAEETIKRKPGMSVKEFTKVLDEFIEKQKEQKAQANNND